VSADTGSEVFRGVVKPEWIDVNGHMNVAYYSTAFDLAVDALFEQIGITAESIATDRGTTFAVESHMTYKRELNEGDPYKVTAQILAFDHKRIHQFQHLYHAERGFLAATAEWMNLHVDLRSRRVSQWPPRVQSALADTMRAQTDLPSPPAAGNRMLILEPLASCRGYRD